MVNNILNAIERFKNEPRGDYDSGLKKKVFYAGWAITVTCTTL